MTKGVQDRMLEVERIRNAFHAAIYNAPDVALALRLAAEGCQVINLPSGSGATGHEALRRFLVEDVLPHRPADLAFRRVSRTGDRWRFAQEDLVSFTHDRELPWLLPGVAATGRRVEVLAVSMTTVERTTVTSVRTLWDQLGLLAQLGLEPAVTTAPAQRGPA